MVTMANSSGSRCAAWTSATTTPPPRERCRSGSTCTGPRRTSPSSATTSTPWATTTARWAASTSTRTASRCTATAPVTRSPTCRIAATRSTTSLSGASESVVVNGNVNHWRITHNRIHDNNNIGIDAIGFEPTLSGPARYTRANRARNGVIADNVIRNIISRGNPAYCEDGGWCNCADGIYIDGGSGIRVERNRVIGNDIGIEVAAENARGSADHVVVADNFITRSGYVGIATGGYCDGRRRLRRRGDGPSLRQPLPAQHPVRQQPVRRRLPGDPGAVPRHPHRDPRERRPRDRSGAAPGRDRAACPGRCLEHRAPARRQPLLRRRRSDARVVRRARARRTRAGRPTATPPDRTRTAGTPIRGCVTRLAETCTSAPARPAVDAGLAGECRAGSGTATSTASAGCRAPASTSAPTSEAEPRHDRHHVRPPDHDLVTEGVR